MDSWPWTIGCGDLSLYFYDGPCWWGGFEPIFLRWDCRWIWAYNSTLGAPKGMVGNCYFSLYFYRGAIFAEPSFLCQKSMAIYLAPQIAGLSFAVQSKWTNLILRLVHICLFNNRSPINLQSHLDLAICFVPTINCFHKTAWPSRNGRAISSHPIYLLQISHSSRICRAISVELIWQSKLHGQLFPSSKDCPMLICITISASHFICPIIRGLILRPLIIWPSKMLGLNVEPTSWHGSDDPSKLRFEVAFLIGICSKSHLKMQHLCKRAFCSKKTRIFWHFVPKCVFICLFWKKRPVCSKLDPKKRHPIS